MIKYCIIEKCVRLSPKNIYDSINILRGADCKCETRDIIAELMMEI